MTPAASSAARLAAHLDEGDLAPLEAVPGMVGVLVVRTHEDREEHGGIELREAALDVTGTAVAHDDAAEIEDGGIDGTLGRVHGAESDARARVRANRPAFSREPPGTCLRATACGPPEQVPGSIGARMGILDRILRAGEGKKLKALAGLVPDISALEAEMRALSDADLQAKTLNSASGSTTARTWTTCSWRPAAMREAASRVIGQRHFDVQLMGGAALHFGWVAEMKTGEGKTLVSTLPAYLNGLTGKGCTW